ncbi:hypothetical protein C3F00_044465, partial [Pseudomonas sp. MWU13-2860]
AGLLFILPMIWAKTGFQCRKPRIRNRGADPAESAYVLEWVRVLVLAREELTNLRRKNRT